MKKHGWPEALHDYIESVMSKSFDYGAFDCALFCADWVQIATGVDHAAPLRGYHSMIEAYKIIAGYGSMEKMVTALMSAEPIHCAMAQRGDVVLLRDHPALNGLPECLGVCIGLHSAFPREMGLLMIPTLQGAGAWRVG